MTLSPATAIAKNVISPDAASANRTAARRRAKTHARTTPAIAPSRTGHFSVPSSECSANDGACEAGLVRWRSLASDEVCWRLNSGWPVAIQSTATQSTGAIAA